MARKVFRSKKTPEPDFTPRPVSARMPPFVSFQVISHPTPHNHIESARNLMGSDRAGANKKRREKRNLKNLKTQEKKQAAAAK